jgi:hypothetical protein
VLRELFWRALSFFLAAESVVSRNIANRKKRHRVRAGTHTTQLQVSDEEHDDSPQYPPTLHPLHHHHSLPPPRSALPPSPVPSPQCSSRRRIRIPPRDTPACDTLHLISSPVPQYEETKKKKTSPISRLTQFPKLHHEPPHLPHSGLDPLGRPIADPPSFDFRNTPCEDGCK